MHTTEQVETTGTDYVAKGLISKRDLMTFRALGGTGLKINVFDGEGKFAPQHQWLHVTGATEAIDHALATVRVRVMH